MRDRVGVGWRPELAATLLGMLDQIEILEVLAGDPTPPASLALLARRVPIYLHGTDLGLAGSAPLPARRLDRLARLVDTVEPEGWSEHLAFVRAGGRELGHLAAPPRNAESIAAAVRNLAHARRVVGSAPLVENIATLMDPPGSTMGEPAWLGGVLAASGAGLLLDLHNLHANATNFGWSAHRLLDELPLDRVGMVHVAGGRWVTAEHGGARRLLDDHLHEVPAPVYSLLTELAVRAPRPLTVVLERDGDFPAPAELSAELGRIRAALARGRAARTVRP